MDNKTPDSAPVEIPVGLEAELQRLCAEFTFKNKHVGEHYGLQLTTQVSIEAQLTDQGGQE